MSPFVQALIGAIIWALANIVYVDMRRRGTRGFGRIVAFWLRNPTTWLSLLFVPEGFVPRFDPPPDDDGALLREVRRDRASRELSAPGADRPAEGDDRTEAPDD